MENSNATPMVGVPQIWYRDPQQAYRLTSVLAFRSTKLTAICCDANEGPARRHQNTPAPFYPSKSTQPTIHLQHDSLTASPPSSPPLNKTMQPLILSAPGMPSLEVPVMHKVGPGGPSAGGEVFQVEIWDSTCKAIDQGNAVAEWLAEFLGRVSELSQAAQQGIVGFVTRSVAYPLLHTCRSYVCQPVVVRWGHGG